MIGLPVREPRTDSPGTGGLELGTFPCALVFEALMSLLLIPKRKDRPLPETDAVTPRLHPLAAPYEPQVARTLQRMMPPGMEPLNLFRVVAHNPAILDKLRSTGAYLLNFGTLDPVDRELVIHRTCARCGCEYEWGVHAWVFGRAVGLSREQIAATADGSAPTPPWSPRQQTLIEMVDQLHDTSSLSDALFCTLRSLFTDAQVVELLALAGQYHGVSFLANGLRVELESDAARFPVPLPGDARGSSRPESGR
jgi:4-carboxymuconolactone decarboxylase